MTTNPVRLDRLMAGMLELVESRAPAGASVHWVPVIEPEENLSDPHFSIRLVSGPAPRAGLARASVFSRVLPLAFTLTVGSTLTEGDTLRFRVSGRTFSENVAAGDTPEAVRDRLLVQLAQPLVDATFTANGTDAIDVASSEYGDLYGVDAAGPGSIVTTTSSLCKIQFDQVRSEVEVQAYSRDRYPMSGAQVALSRITQALELPASHAILDAYNLSVTPGAVLDLTALSGPEWESRSAVTLSVFQPSVSAEPVQAIQSSRFSIEARGLPGTEEVTGETS